MSWIFIPGGPSRCSTASIESGHIPAAIAFVLIFPIYFYYQTLVNTEILAPVLGGYFTAGAIAATPLLLYGAWRHRLPLASDSALTATLFACFLFLLGLAVTGGIQSGADEEITSSHLAYLFKFVGLFLVARLAHAQATWFRRLSLALLVTIIGLVIATGRDGRFLQAAVLSDLADLPVLLDYQGLAYVFIVIAIYAIPLVRAEVRWLIYASSLASLFLIGARSEFAGFIMMAVIIEYCHAKARTVFLGMALMALVALSVAYFLYQDAIADHRIFGLLKLSSDQSAMERAEMHAEAVRTIAKNPFFGMYASYESGHYAHNILSAWVDLGLLGFTTLVFLQVLPTATLLQRFARDSRDPMYIQVLAAQLFTTLLLLLAKNFTYQMIPIALGMYCRYQALRGWTRREARGR